MQKVDRVLLETFHQKGRAMSKTSDFFMCFRAEKLYEMYEY